MIRRRVVAALLILASPFLGFLFRAVLLQWALWLDPSGGEGTRILADVGGMAIGLGGTALGIIEAVKASV